MVSRTRWNVDCALLLSLVALASPPAGQAQLRPGPVSFRFVRHDIKLIPYKARELTYQSKTLTDPSADWASAAGTRWDGKFSEDGYNYQIDDFVFDKIPATIGATVDSAGVVKLDSPVSLQIAAAGAISAAAKHQQMTAQLYVELATGCTMGRDASGADVSTYKFSVKHSCATDKVQILFGSELHFATDLNLTIYDGSGLLGTGIAGYRLGVAVTSIYTADTTDRISLESIDPTAGTLLQPGDSPGFAAFVRYSLQSKTDANLALRVYNHQDDGSPAGTDLLLASSEFATVKRGSGTATYTPQSFKIPDDATEIRVKAVLIDRTLDKVIAEDVATYKVSQVKIRLRMKVGNKWVTSALSGDGAQLLAGGWNSARSLGIVGFAAECTLNSPTLQDQYRDMRVVLEAVGLRGGIPVSVERIGTLPECWSPQVEPPAGYASPFWIPAVEQLALRARLVSSSGEIAPSDPIADGLVMPVESIRIIHEESDSPENRTLTRGEDEKFTYTVEFTNWISDAAQVRWTASQGSREYYDTLPDFLPTGTFRKKVQFSATVFPDSVGVFVGFEIRSIRQLSSVARSDNDVYRKIQFSVDLPAGAGASRDIPGVANLKVLSNAKDRALKLITDAASAAGAYVRSLLSAPGKTERVAAVPSEFLAINRLWQFDAPIPADGSFQAVLTLRYPRDVFPDSPDFDESKLVALAFDPSTGQAETIPAVIDTQNHTATVQVNSLAAFYTLIVPGPFPSGALYAPLLESSDVSATGLALLNTGSATAKMTLQGFQDSGDALAGDGVTNPASVSIPGGQQQYLTAAKAFGVATTSGWTGVTGPNRNLAGYELLARGNSLDGLTLPKTAAASYVLTGIEADAIGTSEIHLVNPSPFDMTVTLTLADNTGATVGTYTAGLAPGATLVRSIASLFPGLATPFSGYLRLQGDHVFLAAQVLNGDRSIAALPAQSPTIDTKTAARLYAPHLASGYGAATRLTLVNPTGTDASITIRGYGDSGAGLSDPVSFKLAAGAQWRRTVADLFSLDPGTMVVGGIAIDSNITGVVGDVSWFDPGPLHSSRASLPLAGQLLTTSLFPYVANGSGLATSLSLFNPNATAASTRVRVFQANGSQAGEKTVTIPARGRSTGSLEGFVSAAAGQVGGYIAVVSDQPLSSLVLLTPTTRGDAAAMAAQDGSGMSFPGGASPGAAIDISPTSLDFGPVATGQSADRTLTIRNTGTASLSVTGLTSNDSRFRVVSPSTPFTVAAGAQQQVTVRFTPTGTGSASGTLTVASNDAARPSVQVALSGTTPGSGSASPSIDVSPIGIDFGSATVGQTKDATLTVRNTGSASLTVSSLSLDSTAFSALSPAWPFTVAAGGRQDITLRFAPKSAGAFSGKLTVSSNDRNVTVNLTGTGVASGGGGSGSGKEAALTPGWDDFSVPLASGRVVWSATPTSSGQLAFTATFELRGSQPNNRFSAGVHFFQPSGTSQPDIGQFGGTWMGGRDSLTREGVTGTILAAYDFGALTTDAQGNASATFSYAVPNRNYYMQFTVRGGDCAANGGSACRAVFRTGAPFAINFETITSVASSSPAIDFSPSTVDFGSVTSGQTKEAVVTVRNTGTAPLTISALSLDNSVFSVVSPSPPFTVAAGGRQDVTLRFAPKSAGALTGKLSIASNDPKGTVTVSLSGTGIASGGGGTSPSGKEAALTPGWDDTSVPLSSGRVVWSATPTASGQFAFTATFELRGSAPNQQFTAGVHFFEPSGNPQQDLPQFGGTWMGGRSPLTRDGVTATVLAAFDFGALATDAQGNASATFSYTVPNRDYFMQFTVRGGDCVASGGSACRCIFRTGQRLGANFETITGTAPASASREAPVTPGWDDFSFPLSSGRVVWSATLTPNSDSTFRVTFELKGSTPNQRFTAGVHFFEPPGTSQAEVTQFGGTKMGGRQALSREGVDGMIVGAYDFGVLATDAQGNASATFSYTIPLRAYYMQFTVRAGDCVNVGGSACRAIYRTGQRFATNFEVLRGGGTNFNALAGFWKFDTGSGAVATDSSGSGNNGTLTGGATWGSGKLGSAVSLNGTTAYVQGGGPGLGFPTGNAARTIAAWIKMSSAGGTDRSVLHYGTGGNSVPAANYHLVVMGNGTAAIGNGSGYGLVQTTARVDDNTWHHLAGVYEGPGTNIARVYVDGIQQASGTLSSVPNTGTGNNWLIGRFLPGPGFFPGLLDEVTIYNGALSVSEIQAMISAGNSGGTTIPGR
jgi:hypothetical protein